MIRLHACHLTKTGIIEILTCECVLNYCNIGGNLSSNGFGCQKKKTSLGFPVLEQKRARVLTRSQERLKPCSDLPNYWRLQSKAFNTFSNISLHDLSSSHINFIALYSYFMNYWLIWVCFISWGILGES